MTRQQRKTNSPTGWTSRSSRRAADGGAILRRSPPLRGWVTVRYASGQRGPAVTRVSSTSRVRISPSPPSAGITSGWETHAPLAQVAEQHPLKLWVLGSSPRGCTARKRSGAVPRRREWGSSPRRGPVRPRPWSVGTQPASWPRSSAGRAPPCRGGCRRIKTGRGRHEVLHHAQHLMRG